MSKKLVDPTGLAKQIWQDVWSVSGATPENCLYTFVELFIFKYLSDLNILKGDFSFSELLRKYDNNEVNDVLHHYADRIRPRIKELFPEGKDKTTIINGTIFVSKDQKAVDGYGAVFKKVLEKFSNYGKLENIDHDFKSKLFESFLKESISKKNWGQFFTPIKVVRAINEMAEGELKEGMVICDPACGVGKFPLEFVKENLEKLFKVENGKINQKVKIIGFDKGFDKDEQKTIILAKANMLIYFCELVKENPTYTKQFANLFNESFILKTNSILGTLSEPIENEYDLILTNPPYVTSGSSNLKEEIAKNNALKNYYKTNAMGIEGLFMEWIIRALKPTGKAFIVIPDGIFNRQNDKNLRQFILDHCFINAIISLPNKTFFTTPKKTYILSITKKDNASQIQTDPVFTYLCSEIGESRDIYRFDIEQDDLKEAVNLFNAFKGNKQYFAALNHDKRCKVKPVDWFIENLRDWNIDLNWTEEERINLGAIEKTNLMSLIEFSSIIEEASQSLKNGAVIIQGEFNTETTQQTYAEFLIGNIFEVKKGLPIYTNSFIKNNSGVYPLYSSQTVNEGIIGNINSFDYDCNCLTWTTDGIYAGTVFVRSGKFSMTTHCGALIPKVEKINLEYIYSYLSENLRNYAKGDQNKRVTVEIIKNVKIKIPVTSTGEFDLQKQKEIAEKYRKIEDIKNNIKVELKKIEDIKVNIDL